jgi:hypothetical protein
VFVHAHTVLPLCIVVLCSLYINATHILLIIPLPIACEEPYSELMIPLMIIAIYYQALASHPARLLTRPSRCGPLQLLIQVLPPACVLLLVLLFLLFLVFLGYQTRIRHYGLRIIGGLLVHLYLLGAAQEVLRQAGRASFRALIDLLLDLRRLGLRSGLIIDLLKKFLAPLVLELFLRFVYHPFQSPHVIHPTRQQCARLVEVLVHFVVLNLRALLQAVHLVELYPGLASVSDCALSGEDLLPGRFKAVYHIEQLDVVFVD